MSNNFYSPQQAKNFTDLYLPSWTGNNPSLLASFYTEDVFYSDPAVPDGISGQQQLLEYFKKLLAKNPNWIWKHNGSIPIENGFLNKWIAEIPVGNKIIFCKGICSIQLRDKLIYRNEVYFDRSELLMEMNLLRNKL
jgi:hypothetical protein